MTLPSLTINGPTSLRVWQSGEWTIGSVPPDSEVQWSFGDVYADQGIPIRHAFSMPGTYQITAALDGQYAHLTVTVT